MVSAAEQLAANLNFGALAKAEELKKRIWFTLGALLVYRLGFSSLRPAAFWACSTCSRAVAFTAWRSLR
jgi:hypothetical protein